MRGEGQIAELVAIAEPDVGVIVNVGPVHLELLGTVERVAAAKAELIRDLPPGPPASCPPSEPLLDEHLRDDARYRTFGAGRRRAAARLRERPGGDRRARARSSSSSCRYAEPHNLLNTLAAVAAARSVGVPASGSVSVQLLVAARRGRGAAGRRYRRERLLQRQPDVDAGCPRSPRGEPRRAPDRRARRDGASWVPTRERFHREIGAHAAQLGIDVLVPVGEDALDYAEGFDGETRPGGRRPRRPARCSSELAQPGDRVLVKGSRSVGLERVLGVESRMGEILIGGMASLLICMFLGPKFIEFLRATRVRPAHPRGGPGRPPRQGGHADDGRLDRAAGGLRAVPDPGRTTDAASLACSARRSRAAGSASRTTDQAAQAALARALRRTKLVVQALIAIGLWLVVTRVRGLPEQLRSASFDAHVDLGLVYPVLIFLVLAGATNGVNLTDGLDGLAAGCAAIVLPRLHRDHVHHRRRHPAGPGAAVGLPGRRAASASSGSTRSRPRSSWATPARSASAARSPALAVMTKTEVLLILIGGIFVIEALSVAIQVFAFQRFRAACS